LLRVLIGPFRRQSKADQHSSAYYFDAQVTERRRDIERPAPEPKVVGRRGNLRPRSFVVWVWQPEEEHCESTIAK